jgi:glycosyltransferase involved in cell wall biosynthesis
MLEPLTLWLSDAAYSVCRHRQEQRTIKWFSRRNLGVLHNAVEVLPPESADPAVRAFLNPEHNDVVALCVGRLSAEKGLLVLAGALDILVAKGLSVPRVVVVGDGPQRAEVEHAFLRHIEAGRACFLGKRSDVRKLLLASDLFVLPSLYENLSMAILEAMEAGLPVLGTRAGGNPELVVENETGLLVPPNDEASLASALSALTCSKTLRARLGRAGRQRVVECFAPQDFERRLEAMYSTLLSEGTKAESHLPRKAMANAAT